MDEQRMAAIHERYARVAGMMDELARRLLGATEALTGGRGDRDSRAGDRHGAGYHRAGERGP